MSLEEKFEAAVKGIQSLPKKGPIQPSDDLKLRFYSLFKQATLGPCNTPKPPFYDLVGRAKWNAWKKLEDTSREEAMSQYVQQMKQLLIETMENNTKAEAEEFGANSTENPHENPFYKFAELHGDELMGTDLFKQ